MTRAKKEQIVAELTSDFTKASGVINCDFNGLGVQDLESFRNDVRASGIKIRVIKNSLASIALDNADKSGLVLNDNNIFIWSDDQVSIAKAVTKFATANEKFTVKSGVFDSTVVNPQEIEAYSKLPGREELLGMLLSTWTAPARGLVGVLSGVQREFVTVLGAINDKKSA